MFEKIIAAPADPILGLADSFRSDPRENKINLGIGVYKDETGKTPVLTTVKKAEKYLLENETTKNYLPISGIPEFGNVTQALLFGEQHPIISEKRARTAQAPGGTGALRIAADFIAQQTTAKRVWISNPTWPNHNNIFQTAGLEICNYDYYDAENHGLDFEGMLASLAKAQAGDVVLFHGCCHNPSGIDPTEEQWRQLAELSAEKGWLPVFDFAYQGFARGLEEDAQGLRLFAEKNPELIVASSYSKNFGLYNERVGACTIVTKDSDTAEKAFSQAKAIIRANYSNPPAHGASVVTTILSNPELKEEWVEELTTMRERIQRMRQLLVTTLQEKGAKQDFSFIIDQNGMFSFSGLNKEQVERLRAEYGIYIVGSGRINVAGLTLENMVPLCEAIVAVL
ncbi:aspartate/tyrosine/aromatic aminotransferase [Proteus cibarius]|uniref:Aminotransferase n=1 Tax=Proteus terrae subsp. cibarius TaxID=626774 RepID=A0ABX6JMW6_9GAMM|nr:MULTISPECIES: amino acid aminotransferase [Proteus]MBG5949933.1 aspartate/tyrosine/aromatic aminotransferase [Proteus terrae]MBG6039310.1 aspartate/tyrosine/aromatic aminotransferase [Proteus terrae subsp. cibarius]MCE9838693.1 aspartate/tyrosine/aromatic aminotransferase [Proteus terrae]MCM2365644.1 aspartate/tyrosine/aromatic aminotransferase [Proteus sp. FZP2095]MCO4181140.1 aspartate/tyrosine/aromatic aminotransferase [Proteus terrae]